MLNNLEEIAENIRKTLEAKNAVREKLINSSRVLTRHCANAIRAMHRQEWDNAQMLLQTAREVLDAMRTSEYPDLFYAGYTQDSFKEFVEASATFAILRGDLLPTPQTLAMEEATYLNGLAEAATELRRYILDIIRHEHSDEAERLLAAMDAIYDILVTFDFPDALTGGLRHRTDSVRGVLERTRGDITLSFRQQRLQAALEQAENQYLPDAPTLTASPSPTVPGEDLEAESSAP
jgi:translin